MWLLFTLKSIQVNMHNNIIYRRRIASPTYNKWAYLNNYQFVLGSKGLDRFLSFGDPFKIFNFTGFKTAANQQICDGRKTSGQDNCSGMAS